MEYPNYLDKHTLNTNSDDMFALRQLRKGDKNTIVHLLKEKINASNGASNYDEFVDYLDNKWDGHLGRQFFIWAETVGLSHREILLVILQTLLDDRSKILNTIHPHLDDIMTKLNIFKMPDELNNTISKDSYSPFNEQPKYNLDDAIGYDPTLLEDLTLHRSGATENNEYSVNIINCICDYVAMF